MSFGGTSYQELQERNLALEAQLREALQLTHSLEAERDRVRTAYHELLVAYELLRRRIFAAKAERLDTTQLELEFEAKRKELDALVAPTASAPGSIDDGPAKRKPAPHGRRNLGDIEALPVERVESVDAEMEVLVAQGKAERISADESSTVMWRRGGAVRVTVVKITYRMHRLEGISDAASTVSANDAPTSEPASLAHDTVAPMANTTNKLAREDSTLITARSPPQMIPRSIAMPSMYAHIIADKFARGMPLYRQEQEFAQTGVPIDRGMMSRWIAIIGRMCGSSVVAAMRRQALQTAFCIATDATGILVQPLRNHEKRQACARGHYFVMVADRDHVLFEYTPRETSAAVAQIFRGYSGYVQADAKSVFDILFRESTDDDSDSDGSSRHEVGCWAHCRRKFYESAITNKDPIAREALFRIRRLFEYEEKWRKLSLAQRKTMREQITRAEIESFYGWAQSEYLKVANQRGLLRSALGYALNQRLALTRFVEDGRLEIDNNRSERAIKQIVIGRKAWLFVGSDDHGQAAANLLSLIASCRLHALDPEEYLRNLFTVLPQWPSDRYLELAPKYWARTRERIDPVLLEREFGWLVVPPSRLTSTEQPTPS